MANLYEIDQAIMACIDAETGEIIDDEALDALMMERTDKIEGIACWIKNLQADAAAYKAEKDAFAERQKRAEAKAESLKNWLAAALNGQKFDTAKCAVSFRKSEKVEILDESLVPKKWLNKTVTYKPDKVAIKEAIKIGLKIKGCSLVESQNISIK